MRTMMIAAGAVLFCLVAGVFVATVHEAVACEDTDSVEWNPWTSNTSDVNGAFSYYGPTFIWHMRDPPYVGAVEFADDLSTNIASVEYSPAYFYPDNCEGAVQVNIHNGLLTQGSSSGTLRTRGWVWDSGTPPPFEEAWHTLNIY